MEISSDPILFLLYLSHINYSEDNIGGRITVEVQV